MKGWKIGAVCLMVVLALFVIFAVNACVPEEVPEEKTLPVLDLENGFSKNNELILRHSIQGERCDFVTRYTSDYSKERWRVTDSKTLSMRAWIECGEGGKTTEWLVEHVHIDVTLKSRFAMVDGILQDTMDDKLHVGLQPGFWITENYPYEGVMVIEGYTETLLKGWGYWTETWGYSELREYRLTEEALVNKGGVYGVKIQVVYDLLIKNEEEEYYHTRCVVDEFIVPVG